MWRMAWFSDLAEQRPLIVELLISSAVAALTGAYLAAMSDLPGSVVLSRMSFTFASLLVVRDLSRGAIAADKAGAPKPLTRWCMGFGQCVQFALVLMILDDTTRIGPIWLSIVILVGALLGAWNAADRAFWEEPATESEVAILAGAGRWAVVAITILWAPLVIVLAANGVGITQLVFLSLLAVAAAHPLPLSRRGGFRVGRSLLQLALIAGGLVLG